MVHVCSFDVEVGIGVPFPPAAQVDGVVDTPDPVAAGDGQADGIVFAVADVGYFQVAQDEIGRASCRERV